MKVEINEQAIVNEVATRLLDEDRDARERMRELLTSFSLEELATAQNVTPRRMREILKERQVFDHFQFDYGHNIKRYPFVAVKEAFAVDLGFLRRLLEKRAERDRKRAA